MGARLLGMAMLAGALIAAPGCVNCDSFKGRFVDPRTLPPPISFNEQVTRLESNMLRLPRLRASSAAGGVTIRYLDDKGNRREERADGTLVLRQRFGEEARGGHDPADVRLVGMIFDRKVFEAGRNSTDWWFIMWLDINQAWVGNARRPVEFGALPSRQRGVGQVGTFRADVVPVLLGVSPWAIRPAPEESVAMKVDDFLGVNNLMVFGPRNDLGGGMGARTALRREIIVGRNSEQIEEVRLYDTAGVMVMRSILSDYREAEVLTENADDAPPAPAEKGPRFPHRVTLEYPARNMEIALTFDRVVIPLRDASYDTPEADEGLKVNPVD